MCLCQQPRHGTNVFHSLCKQKSYYSPYPQELGHFPESHPHHQKEFIYEYWLPQYKESQVLTIKEPFRALLGVEEG